ncbi:MAG: hypothetical protein JW793_06025 [Acidobacteria bacterium]|nr:hypothetical protein [Acidobacteriota bacterium]
MSVKVECYAGYKADQHPVRFILRDRALEVMEIEDQWYSPSKQYFKVRAGDGNVYILCRDEDSDAWDLTAFRKTD